MGLAAVATVNSQPISADNKIDFRKSVRPILEERCFACHGALKQKASLRLDSVALIKKGGESGDIVDVDAPENSELILRLVDKDDSYRMPPEGPPLSREEIERIQNWIEQGAPIPQNDKAELSPKDHWAFQPPRKAKVGSGNPIDTLLERTRSLAGLEATKEVASKSLLLRRVYLDLVGVPPTLEEQEAFERDQSPNAYEKVVDQLLKRPQYGERWGRHWMDVWRYTDWYGLGAQLRNSQKHIWHWRDWIIESLNADKGYDQMIREMLAADELYPLDRSRLRATGFLARNYYLFNRTTWLDSTIEHTGKAFLGLTFNCAKCHDHKYDPISQKDYYQIRAIFEPHQVRLDPLPGNKNLEENGLPRVFDAHPQAQTYIHIRGNEKDPDKSQLMAPNIPSFFDDHSYEPNTIKLPTQAHRPALQPFVLADHQTAIKKEIDKALQAVEKAKLTLEKVQPASNKQNDKPKTYYHEFDFQKSKSRPAFMDNFDSLDEKRWKIVNGKWKTDAGKLTQIEVGATARIVESHTNHPEDFVIETRLAVTGGQLWKSFGIRFDASEQHDKTVYLSGHADSKVQVSFSNNGQTTYPQNALSKIPVQLNTTYTLRIAVRGKKINVSVDGKHLVTYEFPVPRRPGKIQLMSFDSVASFDSIAVYEWPQQAALFDSNSSSTVTREQAQLDLELCQAKVEELNFQLQKIASSHAADLAKLSDPQTTGSADAKSLIKRAAVDQLHHSIAIQKRMRLESHIALVKASSKDRPKHQKNIQAIDGRIQKFKDQLATPGTDYESIRASQKALEGPDEKAESRNSPYPQTTSGRRAAFANWIVSSSNPLTARVAVNQIWMRHFGQPLVDPVTDFGRRAEPPAQQKLLDWLAIDLIEKGWQMKRIHKLIVMSNAYRMSDQENVQSRKQDPENKYYCERRPFRMESQVVRDSLLRLSSQLEEKLGGPPIDPKSQAMSTRRSLYFRQSRDHQHKFVGMFDDADILRCYRRQESIIPQQALTLANSRLAHDSARRIAAQLSKKTKSDTEFVEQAFRLVLCRRPHPEESVACLDSLKELNKSPASKPKPQQGDAKLRARTFVVLAILNSNDFVTIR